MEPDGEAIVPKTDEPAESTSNNDANQVFKKPPDISLTTPVEFKKPAIRREEESSRPTREISSVMMTTSGFLSPAREGKLPESRTPVTAAEPPPSSSVSSLSSNVPPEQPPEIVKKPTKVVKKVSEKKREKIVKKLSADHHPPEKVKRGPSNKSKQSRLNHLNNSNNNDAVSTSTGNNSAKASGSSNKSTQAAKVNKALAAARLKTEKLNTTITPITVKPSGNQSMLDHVDKLFSEPDKKKVNILKKISNVKNEKNDNKTSSKKDDLRQISRESSPDLVIDEPDEIVAKLSNLPSDVTIEPINNPPITSTPRMKSPDKVETSYFDDDSLPGTPSTPKTPEMISHSPPLVKEKRRRKDERKTKRVSVHIYLFLIQFRVLID